jgi:hypothetical protein
VLGAILLWLAWRRGWLKRPGALTGMFFASTGWRASRWSSFRQPDAQFVARATRSASRCTFSPSVGLTMGQLPDAADDPLGLWLILSQARGPGAAAAHEPSDTPDRDADRATGPMTLADYMAECLLHPEHGYYATRDPLGRRAISSPRPKSARCSAS